MPPEENGEVETISWTHMGTIQDMFNAVCELPGVAERVEAYMLGRGVENPREAMKALAGDIF